MAERFKIIPSVYLILDQDGKTLLAQRFNTGFEDGKYGLVSGHAEEKEAFRQALVREVKEEAGIQLRENDIKHVLTMHRDCGDHERADFFFTASAWQGEIKNMEPSKCDDLSWFAPDALPENTIPYIRHAIECYQKGITYTEFSW
ncbi:MAG: NUDIX hydrolase [Candidatus Harrisonbacteria bacterium CG10_big_fil_rev_8_21_14_0_10_49_15]|uniref:NUDIX hydrolase n=1 Tax=Candidatus Harrisonbacteria bacterium CG10_big_fil_rev_8_21_14_0_10_49_15 TaxID=1974587 RepID=A0A2H0UMQ4_9BACT|nr:MAG: NUDIX hydrolase [Candidatus Harrisonbacteria bacterium CG10_big_fil_rev_8_21_14_0_10_49_15]